MKQLYSLLLLCALLTGLPGKAQNWRPFRPNGDVHAFRGLSADTVLTLRLDSAGVQGADSVYYFNRIMRRASAWEWRKSRNNQFGQQLRYNPALRTYVLFWNGGPTTGFILDIALVLKPFARIGETWTSADMDVGVATTLAARSTALIDGVLDSVVTFRLSNMSGTTVVLSKSFGLVSAPANLRFGYPNPRMLTLARRPAPAGLSYYNPLALLDLQPGDELGYYREPIMFSSFPCYAGWSLRRVLSRQLSADSIAYTFQEQSQTTYSSAPSCPGAMVVTSPITLVRAAASRRTGRWAGDGTATTLMLPVNTELLAYEYRPQPRGLRAVMMGHPVVTTRQGSSCGGPALLLQEVLYNTPGGFVYSPGIDALGWQQFVAEGVGPVRQYEQNLTYVRRTVNGTVQTCGSRVNFSTLLPTSAAKRAASFQLHPNPATEVVTLTLGAPGRTTATVRLLDAMGRHVRQQQIASGQAAATLSLEGLAAGVYVVEVQTDGEMPRRLRLQKQ